MSSQLRWSIIKQFSGRNTFGFTFQDVAREFPEKHSVYLARILADMVDKGMLTVALLFFFSLTNIKITGHPNMQLIKP